MTNADGRGILVDIFMSQELNRPTLDERIFDALIRDGYQARREHRLDAARKSFTEAMNLARLSLGENQAALATALNGLAQAERDLQRNDAALRNYEEAVEIYRGLNDPLRLAHTVRHIGDILLDDDRLQEAMPHYDGALKIYREQKQTSSLDYANAVRGYALLNGKMGNAGQAASLWKEAGRIYEAYGIQTGVEESRRRVVQLEKKES